MEQTVSQTSGGFNLSGCISVMLRVIFSPMGRICDQGRTLRPGDEKENAGILGRTRGSEMAFSSLENSRSSARKDKEGQHGPDHLASEVSSRTEAGEQGKLPGRLAVRMA